MKKIVYSSLLAAILIVASATAKRIVAKPGGTPEGNGDVQVMDNDDSISKAVGLVPSLEASNLLELHLAFEDGLIPAFSQPVEISVPKRGEEIDASFPVVSVGDLEETVPSILLTEVLFDPTGIDGTGVNAEFIEFYTTQQTNVAGWILCDQSDNIIYTLPSMTAPANLTVVVFFSQGLPYGHDSDPSDGVMAVALGLPLGDHLPNDSGALKLKDSSGNVVDSVAWGTGSGPPGSSGGFVNLSLAGGAFIEGMSIGRSYNPIVDYTGSISDWAIGGGPTSLGTTPGGLNWIEAGFVQSLVMKAQVGVNQVLDNFNMAGDIPIEVLDAHASSFVASENITDTSVSALHSFEVKRNVSASFFL